MTCKSIIVCLFVAELTHMHVTAKLWDEEPLNVQLEHRMVVNNAQGGSGMQTYVDLERRHSGLNLGQMSALYETYKDLADQRTIMSKYSFFDWVDQR